MYPLRYKTGDVMQIGDVIQWIDDRGCTHLGTIYRLPLQASTTQWGFRESLSSDSIGKVMIKSSQDNESIRLSVDRTVAIPLKDISLNKRSQALAFYITGEEVHQGDYVASNAHLGKFSIYRLLVFHVKNEIEVWEPGDRTIIGLIDDKGERTAIFPYLNDDGAMSWSWEEVVFVSRGKWPDASISNFPCIADI